MTRHTNAFINQNLIHNDRKRSRNDADDLDGTPPRQRRRLLDPYVPEQHRRLILNRMMRVFEEEGWPRTVLFTFAYILDVVHTRTDISTRRLNALGTVAIFLAAKYEAEYNQDTTYKHIVDHYFDVDREMLANSEAMILEFLDYNLRMNHPYRVFDSLREHLNMKSQNLCSSTRVLMDCCTMDNHFVDASPSRIVAASLYLASNILGKKWTRGMSALTGFTPDELQQDVGHLINSIRVIRQTDDLLRYWSTDRHFEEGVDGHLVLVEEYFGKKSRKNAAKEAPLNPAITIINWVHTHYPRRSD